MADGEHLSEQTRKLWKKPLEGTTKHPQGRLFAPVGDHKGDPWKLAPENWLGQSDSPAHSDIVSWHGSEESSLPRTDEYEHRAHEPGHGVGPDWGDDDEEEYGDDYSVDSKERPMGEYGSVVGMHFGGLEAASERAPRPFIHPARVPQSTLVDPPKGSFSTPKPGGAIASGQYHSEHSILNSETGEKTKDTRWSDVGANYAEKATDLVESGKTLAYRNDVEARGSTSYRTMPETARTWSEDVMSAKVPGGGPGPGGVASKFGWHDDPHAFRNKPHPALVAAAEAGYDPVVLGTDQRGMSQRKLNSYSAEYQMSLPFGESEAQTQRQGYEQTYEQAARVSGAVDFNKASNARREAFDAGRTWSLRKPTS